MPLPPVNANIPNPVPVQPPVGGAQGPANVAPGNPPAAPEPLDGNPPVQAPRMPTGQLVAKLDSLLLRAANTTTNSVDDAALEAAAGTANLDELTRQELSFLAETARASFAAVTAYTGRQIGAALELKDGAFDWKEEDPVAAAIKKALDDQAELAEKLHELVNRRGISGEAFDSLCELAFQCDRRETEILTLAMELADAAEQAGRDKDAAADARLDRRLDALLPRQALSMHGTTADLGLVHDSLRPLVDRLDAFAARGPADITAEELAAYTREVRETANALARAGREGIAVGGDGSRVMPDRRLLDAAAEILRGLEGRLANIRREVVRKTAEKHVALAFASIRRTPLIGDPARLADLAARAPRLAMAANLRHKLLALAEQYAQNPTHELKAEMLAVEEALRPLYPGPIKEEIKNLTGKPPFEAVSDADWKAVTAAISNPRAILPLLTHLVRIGESLEGPLPPEKFLTAASARALFDGDLPFTTLVEARIRGMDDADVDPALDPSRVDNVEPLGSGQANTVYLAKLKDGSQYVFKPEVAGRKGIEPLNLSMDYRPETQVAHLNVATAKAAEHFGLGDVMVKTTVGVLEGQYGTFMEKAPGEACAQFTANNARKQPGCLTAEEIRNLPDDQYEKVLGRIVRQTNRLEWFDMLTGQGDRHSGNYMVQVKTDLTVTVKCIDNDACYPAYRTGLRKVVLDPGRSRYFQSLYKTIIDEYPPELRDEIRRKLESDPGVRRLGNGRLEIDPSKFETGELHWAFRVCTGSDCDVLPEFIDEELHDRLVAMEYGSEAREAYRRDLLARLPANAVDSAMKRLDEAIALARRYKEEGKVISAEDFEKHEVQKRILQPELARPASPIKAMGGFDLNKAGTENAKKIAKESRLQNHGLFAGDLAYSVCRRDWFQ